MEEYKATNSSQGLGIAGLVLGIIALIISFIPCLGMWALVPGIVAITLSAIGYSQANKVNAPKGIIIAALVISILGTAIAGWQLHMLKNVAPNNIEKFGKEFQKALEEELDEGDMEDLERAMEKLEGEIEDITEESIKDVSESASEALKEIADEVEKVADELDDEK
ncbi:MAG: hypothetical protein PF485_06385 [Bacteroidales bacterium]|jgi:gas vesicle protein|nr:hypothetical protein [Bacteroidales bacterium]